MVLSKIDEDICVGEDEDNIDSPMRELCDMLSGVSVADSSSSSSAPADVLNRDKLSLNLIDCLSVQDSSLSETSSLPGLSDAVRLPSEPSDAVNSLDTALSQSEPLDVPSLPQQLDMSPSSLPGLSDAVRLPSEPSDAVTLLDTALSQSGPLDVPSLPQQLDISPSPSKSSEANKTAQTVLNRLDLMETTLSNLLLHESIDKINLIKQSHASEMELLIESHKSTLKQKDENIARLKEKVSELEKMLKTVNPEMINKMEKTISKKDSYISKISEDNIRLEGERDELKNAVKNLKIIGEKNILELRKMGEERDNLLSKKDDEVRLNDGWQTPRPSKFKNPEVLIVGNSNIRQLDPKFLKPLFVKKHLLQEKTLRGAAEYLKTTDVKPSKYIVVQAIDNDVSDVPNKEIISTVNDIKIICQSRFPDAKLFIMEPLGRCTSSRPRLYWDKATGLCTLLSSLEGIDVIKIPSRLKKADATMFFRERDGYIHLNHSGIGALSKVYRDTLLVNVGDRKTDNPGQMSAHNVRDFEKTNEVEPDRFGLLVQTLIKGLSSLT